MRHPIQLAALLLTASMAHAQMHMPQLSHKEKEKGEDVSWLAPYATPAPDGRGNDLLRDTHFRLFLRDHLTARQIFWNENESLADTAIEFLGVPGQVILDDNRYLSFDGCVPHFCPSRGLLFVDLGTAHPLVVFIAVDWVKDNKVPGQTGAEYTLWLFSNRALNIAGGTDDASTEHVPPALIHIISRWAAQPTAGTTVLPNITNSVLVDPTGTPHQVPPASLGITPASKQTSAPPETQK
jgi:hypothetical protein